MLLVTETLKVLPLHVLSMLKHPALIENNISKANSVKLAVDCCERAYELTRMLLLPVKETMVCLYPRLYPLQAISDEDGYPESDLVGSDMFICLYVHPYVFFFMLWCVVWSTCLTCVPSGCGHGPPPRALATMVEVQCGEC